MELYAALAILRLQPTTARFSAEVYSLVCSADTLLSNRRHGLQFSRSVLTSGRAVQTIYGVLLRRENHLKGRADT